MSNANQTRETLIEIFRVVLNLESGISNEKIVCLTRDEMPDWDSMNMLNLLLAVEEDFSVKIPDEESARLDSFLKFEDFLCRTKT